MKKIRLIAALLVAATSLGLVACAGDSTTSTDTSVDTTVADTTVETEPERVSGLPDTDWEGRAITFATRSSDYGGWETFEIFTEAENGEPINDSVYARNSAVEDKYNIVVAEKKMADMANNITKLVQAGDASFDAIIASGSQTTLLMNSKLLLDLYGIENLNLENEWWDQQANHDFSVGGKLYMTVGDIMISDKDGSWVYTFNKNLADNYNIEYPYELARNGQWTYDKFYDMAKIVSADLDGDGEMNPEYDQYGIGTESYDTYAAFFYSGARIFDLVDGYPQLVLNTERNITAFMDYMDIVNDKSVYYSFTSNALDRPMFEEGRSLFRGTTMLSIRKYYREVEHDFGIVVAPKYDEAQENYAHIVSIGSSSSTLSVPMTTPDTAFTGFVIEALGFASTDTLLDAYLNTAFNGKYLRDEESIEMLQLCIGSRVYDLSIIQTNWGGWFSYLWGLCPGDTADLASMYASNEASVKKQLEEAYASFKE